MRHLLGFGDENFMTDPSHHPPTPNAHDVDVVEIA